MINNFYKITGISFEDYYKKMYYNIRSQIYKRVNTFDNEDLVQDSFLHLLKQINYYDRTKSGLDTFFVRITLNRMSQLNKKKKLNTITTNNWDSISDVLRDYKKENDTLYDERLKHIEKYIKINPELYNKLYQSKLKGNTIEETSVLLGIDKKIISRFWQKVTRNIPKSLKNNNCINKKRKKIDNETIDKIVELRNQGLSFEKIGKKLKLNRTYVLRLYKSVTGYSPNPKNKKLIYIYKKNNEGKYVVDNIINNPYFTIKD
jgi:RNA polymerase sigma factor (sigma-70 family)